MKESHNNTGVQTWNLCNKPVYKQGCYALAAPGGPWQLTFPLGLLGNPFFFPWTVDFTGSEDWAPFIFLRVQPWQKVFKLLHCLCCTTTVPNCLYSLSKMIATVQWNDSNLGTGERGEGGGNSLIWPKQVSVAAQDIVFRLWSFKKSEAKVRWVV